MKDIRETSIEAYKEVLENGKINKVQKRVLELLIKEGPSTANELDEILLAQGIKYPKASARLGELRDMGTVDEMDKRTCSISGKTVLVWKYNGRQPTKRVRSKSDKTLAKEATYKKLKTILYLIEKKASYTELEYEVEMLEPLIRKI